MGKLLLGALWAIALPVGAGAAAGPPPLDPEEVEIGRRIYIENCASCHGLEAEGALDWREPNAAGELPAPPHGPAGHTWRHSDADLFHMISEGWRDPFNKTDRLTMPAFEEVLAPEEIQAVVTYLKTLWTPEQRRFQWEESRKQEQPLAE